jgi:hypothetical protein
VIITLTHTLRRVVIFPEDLQQLLVACHGWVIHHAHRFGMTGFAGAHFTVGFGV